MGQSSNIIEDLQTKQNFLKKFLSKNLPRKMKLAEKLRKKNVQENFFSQIIRRGVQRRSHQIETRSIHRIRRAGRHRRRRGQRRINA